LVNYRGSHGLGQKCIEAIYGRIGPLPSRDVDLSIEAALKVANRKIDEKRMAIIGFSTGGMIAAQQIGDHPLRYKACILKNPNINASTMIGSVDMPDWTFGECLNSSQRFPPTAEDAAIMFKQSPIASVGKVKTPTLFLLGGKDKRIPASQALQFRHNLRALGVPNRALFYPDDYHGLDSVRTEIDAWTNALLWIQKWCV